MSPEPPAATVRFRFAKLAAAILLGITTNSGWLAATELFRLPTANRAIFEPGREAEFFVPTVGKTWNTGTFGCVRSDGWQMHEGLDIKCLERDRRGEPIDPVTAAADGMVVYLNPSASLSPYGRYVVLRHRMEGIDVFTLYAHLSEIRADLRTGSNLKAGERLGTMGRTANTRQVISKERAHVHFEIALLANERFAEWYKKEFPGQRNDHGPWNGQNLLGLDPRRLLLAQRDQGPAFNLLPFIRSQTELCRVLVRDTSFPWLTRYRPLIRRSAVAEREGVAGYELVLNYNGVPFQLIPRAASEIKTQGRVQLLNVNETEQQARPCRKLVIKRKGRWELTNAGQQLIELVAF